MRPAIFRWFPGSSRCCAIRTSACGPRPCSIWLTTRAVDPLRRIQELDAFAEVSVVSGIVAFLAQSGDRERLPEARVLMDRMIAHRGESGKAARVEAASLIGILGDDFDSQLDALLADEDLEVVRAAIRSAGKLRKRRVAPRLIRLLSREGARGDAAEALAAMGDGVLGTLRDELMDGHVPLATRREIPAVLARLGNQGAVNALAENLLESDPELRLGTIRALNHLRRDFPNTRIDPARLRAALGFEMMLHCRTSQIASVAGQGGPQSSEKQSTGVLRRLEAARDQEIEGIFRILSLLYPATDFRSAHFGLRSGDATARDHALEFLELTLDKTLRKSLVSLLDPTTSPDERVAPILKRTGVEAPTARELAASLVESSDPWLKACGIASVGTLRLTALAGHVESCLDAEDELLREAARTAKSQLEGRSP